VIIIIFENLYFTGMYIVTTLLQFSTECAVEKKMKIGQYFAKIWTKNVAYFFGPPGRSTTSSLYGLLYGICDMMMMTVMKTTISCI